MTPALKVGDAAVATPVARASIRTGDVIVFHRPGDPAGAPPFVHRVVHVGRDRDGTPTVRTKGDANNVADSRTLRLEGTRVWRVRTVLPRAGSAIQWVRAALRGEHSDTIVGGAGLLFGAGLIVTAVRPRRRAAEVV
jgi:signal peptidase